MPLPTSEKLPRSIHEIAAELLITHLPEWLTSKMNPKGMAMKQMTNIYTTCSTLKMQAINLESLLVLFMDFSIGMGKKPHP